MSVVSIAIDGPAGAGKSTLSRKLAQSLGFLYVDTGAIYRTLGLFVEQNGKRCSDPKEVIGLLDQVHIELRHEKDGFQHMYLQGVDVTEEIRSNRVSSYASLVSAIPEVRSFLLEMQRTLAKHHNVVMDGRDIGTVVLPEAKVKIFLTASPECRAMRRQRELSEKGNELPFSQVLQEIVERDEADQNRPVAPLRQAEDAVLLDTSTMNFEESLDALLSLVKERLPV